jgi:hypothetical protein
MPLILWVQRDHIYVHKSQMIVLYVEENTLILSLTQDKFGSFHNTTCFFSNLVSEFKVKIYFYIQ